MDWFLIDPPIPYEPDVKVGLGLVERNGVWHVLDWIGEDSYPYASDYLEEVRRYGVSSRCPHGLDLSKLTRKSRILVIHPKAIPTNWDEVRAVGFEEAGQPCPLCKHDGDCESHKGLDVFCIRHLWALAPADRRLKGGTIRRFPRKNPLFTYDVGRYLAEPQWQPGLIATFPITNIVIIRPRVQDESYGNLKAAAESKLASTGFDLEEVDA